MIKPQDEKKIKMQGVFKITCKRPDGSIKWQEEVPNIVTNVGLNHTLDVVLHNATQTSTWYIGLKGSGTPAASDTMASHANWSEVTAYSESTRQEYAEGAASGQSISNSGSPASFSINADNTTIAGAFLASSSTKGESSSTLFSVADFSSSKTGDNGDTIEVTYTVNASSS